MRYYGYYGQRATAVGVEWIAVTSPHAHTRVRTHTHARGPSARVAKLSKSRKRRSRFILPGCLRVVIGNLHDEVDGDERRARRVLRAREVLVPFIVGWCARARGSSPATRWQARGARSVAPIPLFAATFTGAQGGRKGQTEEWGEGGICL